MPLPTPTQPDTLTATRVATSTNRSFFIAIPYVAAHGVEGNCNTNRGQCSSAQKPQVDSNALSLATVLTALKANNSAAFRGRRHLRDLRLLAELAAVRLCCVHGSGHAAFSIGNLAAVFVSGDARQ